jgi:hypothetical protein
MPAHLIVEGVKTPVLLSTGRQTPLIVTNPSGAALTVPYIPTIKLAVGESPPTGFVGLIVRQL